MRRALPIYLDAHAGMPLLDAAAATLREYCDRDHGLYGNPQSALHRQGQGTMEAVIKAANRVAELLGSGVRAREVIWTSSATESIQLAFRLALESFTGPGWTPSRRGDAWHPLLITFEAEHSATLHAADWARQAGIADCLILPCDSRGAYDPQRLRDAIARERTQGRRFLFVSALWASNEVGTIQPVADLSSVCAELDVPLHLDATQAVAWLETRPWELPALACLSMASHKIGGPAGAGALVIRGRGPGTWNHPDVRGQAEQGVLRPGTLPVPAILGFGAAAAAFRLHRGEYAARAHQLTRRLWQQIEMGLPETLRERCRLQGPELDPESLGETGVSRDWKRLPNNLNIGFERVAGQELYGNLAGQVACSPGSACRSQTGQPSHVLRALGIPPERAHATLRLGLWPGLTEPQIDQAAEIIAHAVTQAAEP
jgi:cysteine desulfurase